MLNRLGIFDLFAYAIPGGIYVSAVISVLHLWPSDITLLFGELNASTLVVYLVVSYVIGIIVSPIKKTPWDRVFPYTDLNTVLDRLQRTYPNVTLKIQPDQWPVIQANIALEDREFSLAIDKFRATHIMLRNTSCALCVYVAIAAIYSLQHPGSIVSWVGMIGAISASALAAKSSRTFSSWTYGYTFGLMIARVLQPEDFVQRNIQDESEHGT